MMVSQEKRTLVVKNKITQSPPTGAGLLMTMTKMPKSSINLQLSLKMFLPKLSYILALKLLLKKDVVVMMASKASNQMLSAGRPSLLIKKKTTDDTDGAFRIENLDLEKKYRYYVILSAQYKDEIIYTNSDGVYITDRDNFDDDDDGEIAPYAAGLIAMAAAICCILLLLLLLLIIFLCVYRNKDDKYQTVVQRQG